MKELNDQELEQYLSQVPEVVREAAVGPSTAMVIGQISQQKRLHVDQIGLLAQLNRNALLGLVTPQEFFDELVGSGLSASEAKDILKTINEKIFVPLRTQEEEHGFAGKPVEPLKVPDTAAVEAPIKKDVPAAPQGSGLGDVLRKITAAPSSNMLADHEEPHIEVTSAERAPLTAQIPAPKAAPIPENLPGAMPPITPRPAPKPAEPSVPVSYVKSYSVDPYREPIDEPPTA